MGYFCWHNNDLPIFYPTNILPCTVSRYTLIQQLRFMDNILIKQSWHGWSHLFICLFKFIFLPEVDLEEDQSCPRPHIPPTSENLMIFINLYTNSIIKCNFCTSTWNNLYPVSMVGSTHHTRNPVIYLIDIVPYNVATISIKMMQISWLVSFLLSKNKVNL